MILSQPVTGRKATMMNSPPMIVSGTTDTIPARMADKYVFSLSAVSAGTIRLFRNPVAWFIRPPLARICHRGRASVPASPNSAQRVSSQGSRGRSPSLPDGQKSNRGVACAGYDFLDHWISRPRFS
jgi:hypothetical protein